MTSDQPKPPYTLSDWLIPAGIGVLSGSIVIAYCLIQMFSRPLSVDNDPGIFFVASPIVFAFGFAPAFVVGLLVSLLRRCYLDKPRP